MTIEEALKELEFTSKKTLLRKKRNMRDGLCGGLKCDQCTIGCCEVNELISCAEHIINHYAHSWLVVIRKKQWESMQNKDEDNGK